MLCIERQLPASRGAAIHRLYAFAIRLAVQPAGPYTKQDVEINLSQVEEERKAYAPLAESSNKAAHVAPIARGDLTRSEEKKWSAQSQACSGCLPEIVVTATRLPSSLFDNWQSFANTWWPGYSFGTCIYQSFAGGGCGAGRWALASLAVVPLAVGKLGAIAAEGAGEGATLLFHGTDAASAADILTNGVNMGRAAELGGGDAFWTTTSSSDAGWFAAANPAGGPGATLSISVPNSVINNLTSSGLLNVQGSVYLFQPGAASILNSAATFTLVP